MYGIIGITIGCAALWQYGPTRHIASAVFASGAVLAVVLGLAAQGTLSNPISGLVLALAQPFRIGDTVTIGDATGKVVRIGVAYTRIDTGSGEHVEIPNTLLGERVIFVKRATRRESAVASSDREPTSHTERAAEG